MTVQEYNKEFLPQIQKAKSFIMLFESGIGHMDDKLVNKNEVYKQFEIRGWSKKN